MRLQNRWMLESRKSHTWIVYFSGLVYLSSLMHLTFKPKSASSKKKKANGRSRWWMTFRTWHSLTPLPGFTHEMQLVDSLLSFVSWEIPFSSHGTTLTFMVCTFLVKCKMVRRIDRSIASHRLWKCLQPLLQMFETYKPYITIYSSQNVKIG